MTRPLNNKLPLGSITTSDLVVYQGPDIPCLNLCKGATVSTVLNKLANKFCCLLESLGVTNYDITCLNVGSCPPKTFQELIQLIISSICDIQTQQGDPGVNGNYVEVENIAPGEDCANGGVLITLYDGVTNEATGSFTVCNGTDGANGLNGINGNYVGITDEVLGECPLGGIVITLYNGADNSVLSTNVFCNATCDCNTVISSDTLSTTGEIPLDSASFSITGSSTGVWYSLYDYPGPNPVNKAALQFTASASGKYRITLEIATLQPQDVNCYMLAAFGINGANPVFFNNVVHPESAYSKQNSLTGFTVYGSSNESNSGVYTHTFILDLAATDTAKLMFYNFAIGTFFIDGNPIIQLLIEKIG